MASQGDPEARAAAGLHQPDEPQRVDRQDDPQHGIGEEEPLSEEQRDGPEQAEPIRKPRTGQDAEAGGGPQQHEEQREHRERPHHEGRRQADAAESAIAGEDLRRSGDQEAQDDEPPAATRHDRPRGRVGVEQRPRLERGRHSGGDRGRGGLATLTATPSAGGSSARPSPRGRARRPRRHRRSRRRRWPRMRAASRPAFLAPPIDTVATGMPAGICTMESSESMPSSVASGTGTPMTGRAVTEASMPGRWAAPPAPAMMTFGARGRAPRGRTAAACRACGAPRRPRPRARCRSR